MKSSAPAQRRAIACESFKSAAEAIGPITPGLSLFALTRGQWSMLDAILHVLDSVGPSTMSVWTWTVAAYDARLLARLRLDGRITAGRLIIDYTAKNDRVRNQMGEVIQDWKAAYGHDSVRYCVNHSKLALIESQSGFRCLLRGSMNLNFNPRFEQFDLTEGGPDFDLVKSIEDDLPVLPDSATAEEAYRAAKVQLAFSQETLDFFGKVKPWRK